MDDECSVSFYDADDFDARDLLGSFYDFISRLALRFRQICISDILADTCGCLHNNASGRSKVPFHLWCPLF
jgi:hypothetical protein